MLHIFNWLRKLDVVILDHRCANFSSLWKYSISHNCQIRPSKLVQGVQKLFVSRTFVVNVV